MLYTVKNEALTLTVHGRGAELWSLRPSGREDVDCLWDGKAEIWPRRAPVCFPWCGQVEGQWFEDRGRRYETGGPHGFVRDEIHVLEERGENYLLLRCDWAGDDSRWPWPFTFYTRHALEGDTVVSTCTAVSRAGRPMPVQLGFHTGLRCPFTAGKTREDYLLRFEKPEAPGGGDVFPLTAESFSQDSICLPGLESAWIQVEERGSGKYLRMEVKDWPYVILWSKPGVPGFVCIEPWTGYAGGGHDLAKRPGARLLGSGERLSRTQRLRVNL